ncbi:MAG: chorismate mutase [Granulosicoccus sp.]|jgi:chorismate mutase
MSNSFLIFIVVVEAIIIIWLASKLTQYKRIDQLLAANKAENTHGPAKARNGSMSQGTSSDSAMSRSGKSLPATMENQESGILVDGAPEENIEEAKQLQWVMARCRYAEFYLEQLDDDYERGQFRHIIDGCVAKARKITDPFFNASALHSIILLLDQAGWEQYRDSLLSEVADDIVRERIEAELVSPEEA